MIRSGPKLAFDRVTRLAQRLLAVPVALASVVDADRQWFASRCGLSVDSTQREQAFCTYTIEHDSIFVVPDAGADRRFSSNPLVTGEPHIRFHAGAPLTVAPGLRLRSLYAIDTQPRDFTPEDLRRLTGLAGLIAGEIWLQDLERDVRTEFLLRQGTSPEHPPSVEDDPITVPQLLAARGLLNWSVAKLAAATHVSSPTIQRIEASEKPSAIREDIARSIVNYAMIKVS